MENHAIVQRKAIAKECGIKGYYKLRKVELTTCFGSDKISRKKSNIFDEQISNDPTPILQPAPWRPSNFAAKSKQNIKNIFTKGM